MEGKNSKFNLDYTLKVAFEKLIAREPEDVCRLSGASYEKPTASYHIKYLGFPVTVNVTEKTVVSKEKSLTIQEIILIIHYMATCNSNEIEKGDELISYKELPGGEMYLNPFISRTIKPFLKIFGESPILLEKVASKWSGQLESYGDVSISLTVFPMVKLYYVIWSGDHEFPANATVLFPRRIACYFNTEDVAVLASQLVYQMPSALS